MGRNQKRNNQQQIVECTAKIMAVRIFKIGQQIIEYQNFITRHCNKADLASRQPFMIHIPCFILSKG
jgi:hypothetical protein